MNRRIDSYRFLNNTLGWVCFLIAAVTYLLTVEPTASFWDCPEYIAVASRLEIGHPPGNPVFMLTARFFVSVFELFGAGPDKAALAVNCMSALLSAATILLLFWTVTALTRRLMVDDRAADSVNVIGRGRVAIIMAAGVCGALAYTWSDTFWFSAVEAEVYAFSSLCTALVFWLALKWDNHADEPHAGRYLLLIAYIMGVSVGVHLLNLLCIPAIALIIYFRRARKVEWLGVVMALVAGVVSLALILYGLVPGSLLMAGEFDVFFVNEVGLSFNQGVLIYAVLFVGIMVWALAELWHQKSYWRIVASTLLAVVVSGIPFLGGWWAGLGVVVLAVALIIWKRPALRVRLLEMAVACELLVFVGVASYALLLIRATANPPMNQAQVDNVFDLKGYIEREQYGTNPLLYGNTFAEDVEIVNDSKHGTMAILNPDGSPHMVAADISKVLPSGLYEFTTETGYRKAVKKTPGEKDRYVKMREKTEYQNDPVFNMLLTRIHATSQFDVNNYHTWTGYRTLDLTGGEKRRLLEAAVTGTDGRLMVPIDSVEPLLAAAPGAVKRSLPVYNADGTMEMKERHQIAPDQWTNVKFFFAYQFYHMYLRYLLWNFVGRQNDFAGNGEATRGNWITGIPLFDDWRTGPAELMPDEFGKGNKGRNLYYGLPMLLAILGMVWQYKRRRDGVRTGRRQFWVVMMLFFMTGIAIVLYLNQPPGQPRERDYAFAGSFYAFCIWVGMGVPAVAWLLRRWWRRASTVIACVAAVAIPLQMLSQTWDDHNRSGRYTARDFAFNLLLSLDDDAVIFTSGDNDTFPLWYAQEVEGCRPDVRIVCLAYIGNEWYIDEMFTPSYTADAVALDITPEEYAYDRLRFAHLSAVSGPSDALTALSALRRAQRTGEGSTRLPGQMSFAFDSVAAQARWGAMLPPGVGPQTPVADLLLRRGLDAGAQLQLGLMARSFADGHKRPVYIANSVNGHYRMNMQPWFHSSGLASEFTPYADDAYTINLDKAYRNITEKFRWGGLDAPDGADVYYDEVSRQFVNITRQSLIEVAIRMMRAGAWDSEWYAKARTILDLTRTKLPSKAVPYDNLMLLEMAECYADLWLATGNDSDRRNALAILDEAIDRYAKTVRYYHALSGWKYEYAERSVADSPRRLIAAIALADRIAAATPLNVPVEIRADAYMALYQGTDPAALMWKNEPLPEEVVESIRAYGLTLTPEDMRRSAAAVCDRYDISVTTLLTPQQ